MNAKLEYWLTAHRGWAGIRKNWPLILLGIVMMLALAAISQCAPTARFTSGGRIHPGSCR
jgi:hypothetical protein